jgi:hypothetical protein
MRHSRVQFGELDAQMLLAQCDNMVDALATH